MDLGASLKAAAVLWAPIALALIVLLLLAACVALPLTFYCKPGKLLSPEGQEIAQVLKCTTEPAEIAR